MIRRLTTAVTLLLLLAGCSQDFDPFDVRPVTLGYDSFSVIRYDTARLTLYNMQNPSEIDLENLTITADCEEDTYQYLETILTGSANLPAGTAQNITLEFFDGFPYFTDQPVRCSFTGQNDSRTVNIERVEGTG